MNYRRQVATPITNGEVEAMEGSDLPFHRSAPVHLRHVLSHTQWLQSSAAQTSRSSFGNIFDNRLCGSNGCVGGPVSLKPNKSVSFANVENIISESEVVLFFPFVFLISLLPTSCCT